MILKSDIQLCVCVCVCVCACVCVCERERKREREGGRERERERDNSETDRAADRDGEERLRQKETINSMGGWVVGGGLTSRSLQCTTKHFKNVLTRQTVP